MPTLSMRPGVHATMDITADNARTAGGDGAMGTAGVTWRDLDVPGAATIVAYLRHRAEAYPDRVAYTFMNSERLDGDALTFGELDRRARELAAALQTVDGCFGQRALLLYPTGADFITAFFGTLYAGVIPAPLPVPRRVEDLAPLERVAADCGASFVLTTQALGDTLQPAGRDSSLRTLTWWRTDALPATRGAGDWSPPELTRDTIALLQYTSGSTRAPRGVVVTHGNLVHNVRATQACMNTSPQTRVVTWLPHFHDMGLIGSLLQHIYCLGMSVVMPPLEFLQRPLRWLQIISDTGAELCGAPNFAYDLCVRRTTPEQRAQLDLSKWRVAFCGAEPVRLQTFERFVKAFAPAGFRPEHFYPCYGLAEATLIASGGPSSTLPRMHCVDRAALANGRVIPALPATSGATALVGCGHIIPDTEAVIVDPAARTRCGPDTVGEIWLAGPSVAHGYWNRPEESAETFRAHIADDGAGPFLRTGDLGFLHNGDLYITGRHKDLIIVAGQNLYPQDLEFEAENSHEHIVPNGCAVVPVDIGGGEQVVVIAEVRQDGPPASRTEDNAASVSHAPGPAHSIRTALFERFGAAIHDVRLVEPRTLPRTTSGKLRRFLCRERYLAGEYGIPEAP